MRYPDKVRVQKFRLEGISEKPIYMKDIAGVISFPDERTVETEADDDFNGGDFVWYGVTHVKVLMKNGDCHEYDWTHVDRNGEYSPRSMITVVRNYKFIPKD